MRSSKPMRGGSTVLGGFDSHALPPDIKATQTRTRTARFAPTIIAKAHDYLSAICHNDRDEHCILNAGEDTLSCVAKVHRWRGRLRPTDRPAPSASPTDASARFLAHYIQEAADGAHVVGHRRTGEAAVRQGAYVGHRILAQPRMTLRPCDERAQYAVHIRFTSAYSGALQRAFLGWNAAGGPRKQVARGSCVIEMPQLWPEDRPGHGGNDEPVPPPRRSGSASGGELRLSGPTLLLWGQ